ncbi:MAG: hypothetical protein JXQ75_06395 [Phycisphaerae bacterium]|nr:hypothetical protein [Phycisphaerae bacterium]
MIESLPQSAILQSPIPNLQSPMLGALSGVDAFAIGIILAGVLCQFYHRRFPPGLGTSLFVGATTVGAVTAAFPRDWPATGEIAIVSGVTGLLCALWGFFGWLARYSGGASKRQSTGACPPAGKKPGAAVAPSATFFAWALVSGIVVVVLTAYVLIFATSSRLLNPGRTIERLPAAGLWNIIGLLTATLFWTASAARRQQPTVALILAALLVWWTSLMIPSAVGSYETSTGTLLPLQPEWWTWTFQMQLGLAVLLFVAAVLQELQYRARRRHAWPDRLDDLLEAYSRWPAFIQTEAVLAAVVLILGVFHVMPPGPPSWQLAVGNGVASLVAGATCLFMTYRRWSGNTAGLGIALLALAAAALACSTIPVFMSDADYAEYATRLPVLCNAVLFATALMIAWWSWLGRFWEQQLLDGVPWTTTGRMIPYAHRGAFLVTAVAVLVAFQMALWPEREGVSVEDNTVGRMVAGLFALASLALITARNALRAKSSPTAGLCLVFLAAIAVFVFVRTPASTLHGWIRQHHVVVLSGLALPILLVAQAIPKSRWRCFSLPLWWLALVVLPFGVLVGLFSPKRFPADWVRPAALAILGLLYAIAGWREHRWAVLVLGAVLLLAAAFTLYRSYGTAIVGLS